MEKVALVAPIYHANELHYDFTRQTIESIQPTKEYFDDVRIFTLVNFSLPQFLPSVSLSAKVPMDVIDNPKGNHVGASWNFGIKSAFQQGYEYVIVCNNDIIFHEKAIFNLVKFAKEHKEFLLWTATEWESLRTIRSVSEDQIGTAFNEHPHFSCFMVNPKTIETIGWFDENLKMAYHEDGDYHYRIILSGNKSAQTETARFYHYGSRTIKVDEAIALENVTNYEENRKYIKSKWNTDFHQKGYHPPEDILKEKDIYKHPFNKEENDWRFW
jgi:uncharacterized protein (DUF736 family)